MNPPRRYRRGRLVPPAPEQPEHQSSPIAAAIRAVLGRYQEACLQLTAAERLVLRDVIAARLARDYQLDGASDWPAAEGEDTGG